MGCLLKGPCRIAYGGEVSLGSDTLLLNFTGLGFLKGEYSCDDYFWNHELKQIYPNTIA